jgi:DNA-binding NarL/FixJ family response regulator
MEGVIDDIATQYMSRVAKLTKHQRKILMMHGEGLSHKAMAQRLVIAISTLKTNINALYFKLGFPTDKDHKAFCHAAMCGVIAERLRANGGP